MSARIIGCRLCAQTRHRATGPRRNAGKRLVCHHIRPSLISGPSDRTTTHFKRSAPHRTDSAKRVEHAPPANKVRSAAEPPAGRVYSTQAAEDERYRPTRSDTAPPLATISSSRQTVQRLPSPTSAREKQRPGVVLARRGTAASRGRPHRDAGRQGCDLSIEKRGSPRELDEHVTVEEGRLHEACCAGTPAKTPRLQCGNDGDRHADPREVNCSTCPAPLGPYRWPRRNKPPGSSEKRRQFDATALSTILNAKCPTD
jgi:hypothetical protein